MKHNLQEVFLVRESLDYKLFLGLECIHSCVLWKTELTVSLRNSSQNNVGETHG